MYHPQLLGFSGFLLSLARQTVKMLEQPDNQIIFGATAGEVGKCLELIVRVARGDADVGGL